MATITISGADKYCRYLCAPGGKTSPSRFGSFLEQLGIELPISLREIVQYGWLTPVLRVRLPESFYLNWEHYATISFMNVAESDEWAAQFYLRCATNHPSIVERPETSEGNWYTHYLDRKDHPLTKRILDNAIPTGPGIVDPEPIQHPRGNQTIYPWIDVFSYWQAYELAEILNATILFSPIRDTPQAADRIEWVSTNLKDLRNDTQARIRGVQQRWEKRKPVFDWISRYRTLLAAHLEARGDQDKVLKAAPRLMKQLDLTPDRMREGIRDTLLTLWQYWEPWKGKHEIVPQLIRQHLQEDISRAIDFLRDATGKEIDLGDPFWGVPKDRMNRGWTPLPEVLPYEAFTAKTSFPVQASIYLESLSKLLKFDESKIENVTNIWWPKSVAFRRFCLAFKRLHQYFYSKEGLIDLRESTPVEFITLCALLSEKILRDRVLETRGSGTRSPKFIPLILDSVRSVLSSLKTKGTGIATNELKFVLENRADLHDLPTNPQNPFVSESDFTHSDPLTRRLLSCFCNFAILRNYVAHHDVLDEELAQSPMVEDAIEALLVVTITVLNA